MSASVGGLSLDSEATLVTVAHLDAEVFSGLARLHRAGELVADEVDELLTADRRLARAVPDLATGLNGRVATPPNPGGATPTPQP